MGGVAQVVDHVERSALHNIIIAKPYQDLGISMGEQRSRYPKVLGLNPGLVLNRLEEASEDGGYTLKNQNKAFTGSVPVLGLHPLILGFQFESGRGSCGPCSSSGRATERSGNIIDTSQTCRRT